MCLLTFKCLASKTDSVGLYVVKLRMLNQDVYHYSKHVITCMKKTISKIAIPCVMILIVCFRDLKIWKFQLNSYFGLWLIHIEEGSLSCHTFCDTRLRFLLFHSF